MEASVNHREEKVEGEREFQFLGSDMDTDWAGVVEMACVLCGTPISAVTLVGMDKPVVKASIGKMPWEDVFSPYTFQESDFFLVSDAQLDPRFSWHPSVTEEEGIRFYAGVPLDIQESGRIGILYVMDQVPRELSVVQRSALLTLRNQLVSQIELKKKNRELSEANQELEVCTSKLLESEYAFSTYFNSSNDAVFFIDTRHTVKAFNKLAKTYIQLSTNRQIHIGESLLDFVLESRMPQYLERFEKAREGRETKVETQMQFQGNLVWWLISYMPVRALDREKVVGILITAENIDQRKKAEEALRESKRHIADVADNLPNGAIFQYVLKSDGHTHAFPYVSSGARNLFGHAPEDIMRDPMLIFNNLYPDATRLLQEIYISRDHLTDFDCQYQVQVEGKLKWVHTRSKPRRLQDGSTRWDGLSIDITEQKQAIELLEKTKQDLQAVITTIPDILFRFDKENRYVFCHAGDPSELLFPREHMIGKRIEEVMPPELADLAIESFDQVRKSGEIMVFEYFLDIPLKGKTWFESRIVRTEQEEIMLMVRNITERKDTEAALQESEANLNTVFNNTEVGYYLLNSELKMLAFNQPAELFTQKVHGRELTLDSYFYDYFSEKEWSMLKGTMDVVLGGQVIHYDKKFPFPEEEDVWFYVRYAPISNKMEKVIGVVMTVEDITDRKKNEIGLNRSLELVTEQNKRLLNFSYIVSHNLRSHTSNIKSILDILDYVEVEEERKELIHILRNVSNVLDETIHDLNDVVSIHTNLTHTIESLNLKEYVDKTLLVLGKQIEEKRAKIHNKVPKELMIQYTSAYLDSILLNFISNALKYSHPERDPVVTISCSYGNDKWVLEIEDNGIGIDIQKNGDKLFGMYKTFNGNADAKGIGLFITKNQIEAMGGKVEVQSELGKGSTFRIYIRME